MKTNCRIEGHFKNFLFCILFHIFFICTSFSQSDWVELFSDNFDDGNAEGWKFEFMGPSAKWDVLNNNGNYYLHGEDHNWAQLIDNQPWGNYYFESKIRLIEGGLHLNVRVSMESRYYIGFHQGGVNLNKDYANGDRFNLATKDKNFVAGIWHTVKIFCLNELIKIYVDDNLEIEFADENPILGGSIALETNPGSKIEADDLIVFGEPMPETPDGYSWERTGGPNGGLGYDIRIHPKDKNIMFVTDNPSGVNKSYDGGKTWYQKNDGITKDPNRYGNGAPIFALTIDPNNPNVIWSGTQSQNGIYKSVDCGETWIEKINGIQESNEISFRGFAIHPHNSDVVLSAADISTGIPDPSGMQITTGKIYKTINGGDSWYPVWEGNNLARVLIYDYLNPDIVYCSTGIFDRIAFDRNAETLNSGGVGVLKSVDGGENWFTINNGIENLYVGFLEMHPTNPSILYAAAGGPTYGIEGAVYKTTDGGNHWISILGNYPYYSIVTISKSDPNTIYAGNDYAIYKSKDSGLTWEKFNNQPGDYSYGPPGISAGVPISAVVDPDNPDFLFINSYQGGNFRSEDGAKTWINASKGYSGADLRDIIVDPHRPATVYTTGRTGPFRSYDGGNTWEGLSYAPAMGPLDWFIIEINPDKPNEVFICDEWNGRILKSNDAGVHWRVMFTHPLVNCGNLDKRHGFKAFAISKSNPNIIYAGMRKTVSGGHLEPSYGASYGIFKSTDAGERWVEMNSGLESSMKAINTIVVHPENPDIAYAGTLHDGIYKTVNGGQNWIRTCNGLGFSDVRSLAVDPQNPDIIYAGSGEGKGIYKSIDGGELWFESSQGIDIQCPSYLSPVGKSVMGMDLTVPKALNFSYANFNYIPWTKVLDIVIDPQNTQRVYAADLNTGIYVSEDAGKTWWPVNEGLSVKSVTCLTISNDGRVLYAGTSGAGVHRMVVGGNYAPAIISVIPTNENHISITIGDSLGFEAISFDFNKDTLSYSWYLDGQIIPDVFESIYLFKTNDIFIGEHVLESKISDKDTTVTATWMVNVISPTRVNNVGDSSPYSFSLKQNYPNPFKTTTIIEYQLPSPSKVVLRIFNILGQEIKSLVNEQKTEGFYTTEWDGRNNNNIRVAHGTYICRIEITNNYNTFIQDRKMIVIQ
jgi:photosystem II stability/assembly factor-like uncharacterized protein